MDYYDTLVKTIQRLMDEENYIEAYSILKEELGMPYVPYTHEQELEGLAMACKQALLYEQPTKKHKDEDIETLLFGSVDEACMACEMLRSSNVRKHLDMIQRYLGKEPHHLVRSVLIELLMEQDISEELCIDYEGLEVFVKPLYIESIQTCETTLSMVKSLQDYFENNNPTFYQLCVDSLMKELYLKLPFNVNEDEVDYMVIAIVEYVYKAMGDVAGYKYFINEKKLAMYEGYDLLLYKYGI